MIKDNDAEIKALAAAVLRCAALDIRSKTRQKSAEAAVRAGGIDLYLDLLNVDMSHDAFIKRAKEQRNENYQTVG